jgi:CheY-like chemotaxis protein
VSAFVAPAWENAPDEFAPFAFIVGDEPGALLPLRAMTNLERDKAIVLLVDDREDDVVLTQQAFARANVPNQLFAVRDGAEAIAYLRGEVPFANRAEFPLPDLLLLDINMPKVDGFGVLKWVRSNPQLSNLRVVMLTTSDQMTDIDKAYSMGVNSYVVKPVKFNSYVELIGFLLRFWFENSRAPNLPVPQMASAIRRGEG